MIDADMLACCEQVLGVQPAPAPGFTQIGLRRALRRRHTAVVAAHRGECRLWALAACATTLAASLTLPDDVRQRARSYTRRGRLTP